MSSDFAKTILSQLGGGKFIAMTGAKMFVQSTKDRYLQFKIGSGAKKSINKVIVRLNELDLYDISFCRVTNTNYKTIAEVFNVYGDQLQSIFTDETGFQTSL